MGGEKQKTKNGRGAGSPGSRAVPVEKKIRNNNNNFSRNQSAQFAQYWPGCGGSLKCERNKENVILGLKSQNFARPAGAAHRPLVKDDAS